MVSRILGVLTKSACVFGACMVTFLSDSQAVSAAVVNPPPGDPVVTQEQIDAFYNHPGTQAQLSLSQALFGANTETLLSFGTMPGSLVTNGTGSLQVKGGASHKVIYVGGVEEDLLASVGDQNLDSQGLDRTADLLQIQTDFIQSDLRLFSSIVGVNGPNGLNLAHAFVVEWDNDQGDRETRVLFTELVDPNGWAYSGDPAAIEASEYAYTVETSAGPLVLLFEENQGELVSNGEVAGFTFWRRLNCVLSGLKIGVAMVACVACVGACVVPNPTQLTPAILLTCGCAYKACCNTLQWINDFITSSCGNHMQTHPSWQAFMNIVDIICILA